MKLKKYIALGTILMMTLCGCNSVASKVVTSEDFFKNLSWYEATATVIFLKDNQSNTLSMKQTAKIEGSYEMTYLSPKHLEGTVLSFDGEKIVETYPGSESQIEEKPGVAENEILLTSFAKRYLTSTSAKKQETQLAGKKVVTYEIPIEGDYKYLAKEKIFFDKEKMVPIQLEIYDVEGNVSIQVQYENLKYNF